MAVDDNSIDDVLRIDQDEAVDTDTSICQARLYRSEVHASRDGDGVRAPLQPFGEELRDPLAQLIRVLEELHPVVQWFVPHITFVLHRCSTENDTKPSLENFTRRVTAIVR